MAVVGLRRLEVAVSHGVEDIGVLTNVRGDRWHRDGRRNRGLEGGHSGTGIDGVALGETPAFRLRENATLTTSHPEYSWVNALQIWTLGTVDLQKGEIRVRGYAAA